MAPKATRTIAADALSIGREISQRFFSNQARKFPRVKVTEAQLAILIAIGIEKATKANDTTKEQRR